LIIKKIFCLAAFSSIATVSYANECIDHFNDHVDGSYMYFNDCQLMDQDVDVIVDFVNSHPDIQIINLTNNNITDKGVKKLGLLNHSITDIELSINAIQGKTLANLKNLDLDIIELGNNPIDNDGIKALLLNKQIKALSFGGDNIQDGIASIVSNREFSMLGIESNGMSAEGWKNFAKLSQAQMILVSGKNIADGFGAELATNNFVKGLYVKDNEMNADGFTHIFSNPNITTFQTSHLSDKSAFLEPLAHSQYVNQVYVLPKEDILLNAAIGKYLGENKSINTLVLFSDRDGHHQAVFDADFANAISKNNVAELDIYRFDINDDAANALAQSHQLKSLAIECGQIADIGAIALERSENLTDLTLSNNHVTDKGALAFIDNQYLDSLDLDNNPISKAAADKVKANSKIKNIRINSKNEMHSMNALHLKYGLKRREL
jgi:hypothetical protein